MDAEADGVVETGTGVFVARALTPAVTGPLSESCKVIARDDEHIGKPGRPR